MNNFPSLPDEVWVDIPNYEGLYKISNHGRVLRLKKNTLCPKWKRPDCNMHTISLRKGKLRANPCFELLMEKIFGSGVKSDTSEVWKNIPGYNNIYQASDLGRIRRITTNTFRGRIMRQNMFGKYLFVSLTGPTGGSDLWQVHQLIADTFHINPNNLPQINHLDGNKLNNRADNLERCTRSRNMQHAYDNGLISKVKRNPNILLTQDQVKEIRSMCQVKTSILAKKFNVATNIIQCIKYNRTWYDPSYTPPLTTMRNQWSNKNGNTHTV